jgi:hypothetical protein
MHLAERLAMVVQVLLHQLLVHLSLALVALAVQDKV